MRRALVAFVALAAPLAGGFACSLRDTSYLTSGGGSDGGNSPDVVEEPSPGESSAPDGGPTRTPVTLASNQTNARLLVQDGDSLYWLSGADLVAMKKQGETMPHTVLPNVGMPTALAADPAAGTSDLFYGLPDGTVWRVAKSGGAPTKLGNTTPPPGALALDSDDLFVLAIDPQDTDTPYIYRAARAGGVEKIIAPDDANLEIYGFAIDATNVYWDEGDNAIRSRPKTTVLDAGAPTIVSIPSSPDDFQSAWGPPGFTLDDRYFFYSDNVKLRSFARTPGATPTALLSFGADTEITAIALDATYAYAIEETVKGTLLRNTKDGTGTAELMLAALNKPSALAVDETSVYVTVAGDGTVLRVDK